MGLLLRDVYNGIRAVRICCTLYRRSSCASCRRCRASFRIILFLHRAPAPACCAITSPAPPVYYLYACYCLTPVCTTPLCTAWRGGKHGLHAAEQRAASTHHSACTSIVNVVRRTSCRGRSGGEAAHGLGVTLLDVSDQHRAIAASRTLPPSTTGRRRLRQVLQPYAFAFLFAAHAGMIFCICHSPHLEHAPAFGAALSPHRHLLPLRNAILLQEKRHIRAIDMA